MADIKRLFFDCETTGVLYFKHGIHELSGIIDVNGVIVDKFEFKVCPHPKVIIEDAALEISKKTKEEILSYPDRFDVFKELNELLGKYVDKYTKKDKYFLIGYNNAGFDNYFLRAFWKQCGDDKYFGSWFWPNPIDVYVLISQKLIEKRTEIDDFKLLGIAKYFGINVDETKLHNALYDIEITRELYYKVI